MVVAVYLPLALSLLLPALGFWWSGHPAPGAGVWVLTAGAGLAAGCTLWMLALLIGARVGDVLGWPGYASVPVPRAVSVVAAGAFVGALVRAGRATRRQLRVQRNLRSVRALPGGELVVVRHLRPHAFAVPGSPGRIVATDAMLRALTPAQRRVLLSHERAHLAARHSVALGLVHLAAAVDPLLVPVRQAVAYLCERHADEVAAAEVGDRRLVAGALGAAARASTGEPALALPAFHRLDVVRRVIALSRPPRRVSPLALAAALLGASGVAGLATAAAADATRDFIVMLAARVS